MGREKRRSSRGISNVSFDLLLAYDMKIRTICNLLSRKAVHLVCTVIKRKSPDFKSYSCYLNTDNKQVTKATELRSVVARKKKKKEMMNVGLRQGDT